MIPGIFDNPAASRIGWALLHFLWQGAGIALALKGALTLVEQRFSRLRYALALACLFLMVALPVFLLCKPQRRSTDLPVRYEATQIETVPVAGFSSASNPIRSEPDFRAHVFSFLTLLVPWIAGCWFFGAVLLLLKTIGGVLQVGVLKWKASSRRKLTAVASFHRLAVRAGVADVVILASDLVSVPTVAGWFRLVVLLPKGILEEIDGPMLDALVAHEFAHIRRHDSVINLFQSVMEDLLFFHPAMWWVTRIVRAEREACCDDEAVAMCGDTMVYARALSQAEQFRSTIPVLALSSSPLLQRIRRLTEMRMSKINRITAFCTILIAVSFIILTAAGSVLLATIPAENQKSNISANPPNGRGFDKAEPEAQGTRPHAEGKYSLTCGIVIAKKDEATGKPVFFPPRQEDGKFGGGMCVLLDVSTPKPSKVSGELQPSKLIHRVDPIYPEAAIKTHVGIRVDLHINVNKEGLVTDAEVARALTVPPDRDTKGDWIGGVRSDVIRSINSAAISAVKQWKYSPTLLDRKAIPVRTNVSMDFTFNKDGSPKIVTYAPGS